LGVVETPVVLPPGVLPHALSLSPLTDNNTPVEPVLDAVDASIDTRTEPLIDASSLVLTTLLTTNIITVPTEATHCPDDVTLTGNDVNLPCVDSFVESVVEGVVPMLHQDSSASLTDDNFTDDKISEGHLFALTQLGTIAGLGVIVALAAYIVFKCMK